LHKRYTAVSADFLPFETLRLHASFKKRTADLEIGGPRLDLPAPAVPIQVMDSKDKHKVVRVAQALLKVKNFDIAELQRAYDGQ
jgi:hypothetical protein